MLLWPVSVRLADHCLCVCPFFPDPEPVLGAAPWLVSGRPPPCLPAPAVPTNHSQTVQLCALLSPPCVVLVLLLSVRCYTTTMMQSVCNEPLPTIDSLFSQTSYL